MGKSWLIIILLSVFPKIDGLAGGRTYSALQTFNENMEPTYRFQLYYDGGVGQYKYNSTASPSWQLTNKHFGYTLENVSIKIGSSLFNGYYYGDYNPSNFNNIISAISVGSEGNRPAFISLVGTTVRAWSSQSNFTCYVRIVKQA